MKSIWVAAAIVAAATQVDAGAAPHGDGRIEAAFTYVYTASLAPVGAAGGGEPPLHQGSRRVIVTFPSRTDQPALRGRRTGIGIVGTATYEYTMTGWCLMKDADGDLIVERFEEAWPEGGQRPRARARFAAGPASSPASPGRNDYATRSCVAPSQSARATARAAGWARGGSAPTSPAEVDLPAPRFGRIALRMTRLFDMDDHARLPWRFYGQRLRLAAGA